MIYELPDRLNFYGGLIFFYKKVVIMKKVDKFQRAQDLVKLSKLCYYRFTEFEPSKTSMVNGMSVRQSGISNLYFFVKDPMDQYEVIDILHKYGMRLVGEKYFDDGKKLRLKFDMPEDAVKFANDIKPHGVWGWIRKNTLPLVAKLAAAIERRGSK